MTTFDLASDPRCARPTDLDRLLNDLHRVRAAVEACHQWRPRLDDWRERLADAASVDGNIVPEAQDEAELVSGMDRVQQVALALCTALDATFGIGGLEAVDDEFRSTRRTTGIGTTPPTRDRSNAHVAVDAAQSTAICGVAVTRWT